MGRGNQLGGQKIERGSTKHSATAKTNDQNGRNKKDRVYFTDGGYNKSAKEEEDDRRHKSEKYKQKLLCLPSYETMERLAEKRE